MSFAALDDSALLPLLSYIEPRDLTALLLTNKKLHDFIEENAEELRKFPDVSLQFKWHRECDVEVEAVEEDEEKIRKLVFYIGLHADEPVERKRRRKVSKGSFMVRVDDESRVEARRITDEEGGARAYFCECDGLSPMQVITALLKKFEKRIASKSLWSSCEYKELEKIARHLPTGIDEVHILGEQWDMKEDALLNAVESIQPTSFNASLLTDASISRHFFDSEVVQKLKRLEFHRTFIPCPHDYETELEDEVLAKLEAREFVVHHTLLTVSGVKKLIAEWKEGRRELVKCDLDTAKSAEEERKLLDDITDGLQVVSSRKDGELFSKLVKRKDGKVLNVSLRSDEERGVERWLFVLLLFDEDAVKAFMSMPRSP